MLVGNLVEVKEALVDSALQSLGSLHAVQGSAPVVLLRLVDRVQANCAPTLVLELHELLGMPQLLHAGLLEELGHPRQTNIMPVIVVGLEDRFFPDKQKRTKKGARGELTMER